MGNWAVCLQEVRRTTAGVDVIRMLIQKREHARPPEETWFSIAMGTTVLPMLWLRTGYTTHTT